MKKVLFCLLTVIFMAACNNSKAPDATAEKAVKTDDKPAAASAPSAMGCSSFIWFKKGATMEYSLTDGSGKSLPGTTTHIKDVHQDGAAMIADITMTYANGKEINTIYRCEGDKLFMDMKSLFENNFAGLKKAGMEVETSNAYISFPWRMKPGDNLEGATFEVKTKKGGKEFMTIKSIVKDRKVEGADHLTTAGGSWDCLKLTETRTTSTDMMGRHMMDTDSKTSSWFAPGAGIVKFETYDAKGNLQLRSELVSIK